MPVYEFRCNNCRRKVSILVRGMSPPAAPTCEACGSDNLSRIYSGVALLKSPSGKNAYDNILDDKALTDGLIRNDPRSLADWSRRMSRAAGEDITPESEEILQKLDAGEDVLKVAQEAKASFEVKSGGAPE